MATTKRRSYGTGSLVDLKDGRFRIRAYANGVQKSRTIPGGKKDAEAALRDLHAEIEAGQHGATTEKVNPLFSALLDAWLADVVRRGKPGTVRGVKSTVSSVFKPALGHIRLANLRVADLETFYDSMLDAGRSPGTVRRYHAQLSSALDIGVRREWLVANPAKKARPPAPTQGEIHPPDEADIIRLVEAAKAVDKAFGVAIVVLAVTGMRRAELCGLRWSDIDLDRGFLDIRRSVSRGVEVGTLEIVTPKTQKARRRISLGDDLIDVLRSHRQDMEERAEGVALAADPYVMAAYPDGCQPMNPERLTSLVYRLRDKLGLPNLRIHDLRHYQASNLIAGGVNIRKVSALLGHSRTSVTLDVYSHQFDELERDTATAKIAGRLLAGKES